MPPSRRPCPCHNEWRAEQRAANQRGQLMHAFHFAQNARMYDDQGDVDASDPVEAASACYGCLNNHCEALMTRPDDTRSVRMLPRFNPDSPSQSQADGNTDSEGKE